MIYFPEKTDYPGMLALLDAPEKDPERSLRMIVSSAFAYFDTDPITKYLFKKRFYLIDDYLTKINAIHVKKVLDVGTGIGFFVPTLASYAENVVALDYSDDILEQVSAMARHRGLGNVTTVRGDILELPFEDGAFDLVICMSVLEHFEQLEKPLKELKRVLAPQGLLIVGYPSETLFFRFLHQKVLGWATSKGRKVKKILESEHSDEAFHAPHVSTGKDIARAIGVLGMREECSRSINLVPPFLELYWIHFLRKS